jgi:hypothetical protein
MNELSEFYPYVEMSFIVKNADIFQKSFGGSMSSVPLRRIGLMTRMDRGQEDQEEAVPRAPA